MKTKHKTPLSLQFLIFLQESCKLENIIYIHFNKNKYQMDWKRTYFRKSANGSIFNDRKDISSNKCLFTLSSAYFSDL